jgi:L-Ala-D/L-Glu epimerase
MKVTTHIHSLKSKYPFRIAHGVREETATFIVSLQDGNLEGLGEATPVPYYGITTEIMQSVVNENVELIETTPWTHPAIYWQEMDSVLSKNRFVQCAIDMAAYDIWAKKNQLPLYQALGLSIAHVPLSNYTIGIDEIEVMISKMLEYDFPIYKIKLGTPHDLEIIKALRTHTNAVFRVDANCSWNVEQTIRFSEEFADLGVEFIEQPLPAQDFLGMKEIMKHTQLPIIADESCIQEKDVEACVGYFNGINIKLAKCGGITPALRMIEAARKHKMSVMMGCMTESSVGISAIAQVLPLLDFVDMDGALLINNDPADGVKLNKGVVSYPDRNGTGAILL